MRVLRALGALYLAATYLVIVASRFHYTCDVYLGACMSAGTVFVYHYFMRVCAVDAKARRAPLGALLAWLEATAPDQVVWREVVEGATSELLDA